MNFSNIFKGLSKEEKLYIEQLFEDFDEDSQTKFLIKYKLKRKNPYIYLLLCLLGFLGFAGLHRFYARKYISGVCQFCTIGYFFVGTLIDTMTFINKTSEANIELSEQLAFELRESIYQRRIHIME